MMTPGDADGVTRLETTAKAALALVPGVGGALATVVGDELDRRRRAARETAELVVAGVADSEILLRRLREDEQLSSLFAAAIEAGMRSTLREKRRALAAAITRGVLDGAQIDQEHLVVAVLSDLDVPHLRALEGLRRRVDEADPTRETLEHRAIESQTTGLSAPIEAALVRHGCIQSSSASAFGGSITHWRVTSFGRRVLDELRDPDDSEES